MMRFLCDVRISFTIKTLHSKEVYFTLFPLIFCLSGCVYDPPPKGTDIFVHNQIHHFIYVLDSLPKHNLISVYDHYYVNDKSYVAARSGLLAPFTNVPFLYSDNQYNKSLRKDSLIIFCIFQEDDTSKILDSVWKTLSYRLFRVSSIRVHNNSINHIFVYDDSIIYTNRYNLRFSEKGKS